MLKANKTHNELFREFKVGVVGASQVAFDALARIFALTQCRTRIYQPVRLDAHLSILPSDIDFIILCTNHAATLNYWLNRAPRGQAVQRPMVRVMRSEDSQQHEYVITVPANPARLLKVLDRYTIKELNFLPELKIGGQVRDWCDTAREGVKLLHNARSFNSRINGLRRALVVDDSLAVRKQMEFEFGLMGIGVDGFESADLAIEAASQNAYDIVFLDVVMPGMDGYTACKRIKRLPLNRHVPIVLLTSRSSSFDKIKGALAGCSTYLVKPINHNEFENIVHQHLALSKEIA
jgi:two-component system, cell cycle response regulator